jgi:hypothetical protein
MANIPQFVQPKTGESVRRIGGIAQNLITSLPGLKIQGEEIDRRQKALDEAEKAAKADWSTMTAAYKGIKEQLNVKLTPLVQQGIMTEQEKNNALQNFRMPVNADKKDPKAYMVELGEAINKINQDISTKQSQQRVSGAAKRELLGTPSQPQTPIPQQVGPEQQIRPRATNYNSYRRAIHRTRYIGKRASKAGYTSGTTSRITIGCSKGHITTTGINPWRTTASFPRSKD